MLRLFTYLDIVRVWAYNRHTESAHKEGTQ